jgi:hypothetical protein
MTTTYLLPECKPYTPSRKLSRLMDRNRYAERLARVLGDGAQWEYRGECTDLQRPCGRCACGHEGLRYLFTLHHKLTERTVIVGSVCVETYHGISGQVVAALAAEVDRLQRAELARHKAKHLQAPTLFELKG